MYACVCDWLGFPYREEVQWVSTSLVLELISANCTNDEGTDKSQYVGKGGNTFDKDVFGYVFLTGC